MPRTSPARPIRFGPGTRTPIGRIAAAALPLALAATSGASAQEPARAVQGRVFMDLNYLATERDVADGFRAGQIAGHVVASLSERLTFFGEATGTPHASGLAVEVERAIIRYDYRDYLKLSAGRYHTPIGYWNDAFHHGQWLQTTVSRPEMIKFGSRLLPVHFMGAMAEGVLTPEPVVVAYRLGVGNGRHSNIARGGDAGDVNHHRALTAAASARLPGRAGMMIGAGYYADRVASEGGIDFGERIVSAHVVRERETPEFIAEYARIVHDPVRAGLSTTSSDAWYAQLGYRLPGRGHAFKPYARVEQVHTSAADSLFAPLNLGYRGATAGVRIDLAPTAALKVEYRSEGLQTERRAASVAAQVSFTFPALPGGERVDEP